MWYFSCDGVVKNIIDNLALPKRFYLSILILSFNYLVKYIVL